MDKSTPSFLAKKSPTKDELLRVAMADVQSFIGDEHGYEDIGNFLHRIQLKKSKAFYKRAAKRGDEKKMAFWREKIAKWYGKDKKDPSITPDSPEVQKIIDGISSEISEVIASGINDQETRQYLSDLMMMRHLLVETHLPGVEYSAIEGDHAELQLAREHALRKILRSSQQPSEIIELMLDMDNDKSIGESVARVTSHYRCCEKCGKSAHQKCKSCKSMFYCDSKCQKDDWAAHKEECKAIATGMTWDQVDLESEDPNSIHLRHMQRHALDLGDQEQEEEVGDDSVPELEEVGADVLSAEPIGARGVGPRGGGFRAGPRGGVGPRAGGFRGGAVGPRAPRGAFRGGFFGRGRYRPGYGPAGFLRRLVGGPRAFSRWGGVRRGAGWWWRSPPLWLLPYLILDPLTREYYWNTRYNYSDVVEPGYGPYSDGSPVGYY